MLESNQSVVLATAAITYAYLALVSFVRTWQPANQLQRYGFLFLTLLRCAGPAAMVVLLVTSSLAISTKILIGTVLLLSAVVNVRSRS
jgi:hypothetical protein